MNNEQSLLGEILKHEGYFATKSRQDLFSVLQKSKLPTIATLMKELSEQNQATVYRNLDLFKRLGIIQVFQLGWSSRIKLSSRFRHHHHYMRCINCSFVVKLPEDPKLEKSLHSLANRWKFTNVDHQVEITGLCYSCQLTK